MNYQQRHATCGESRHLADITYAHATLSARHLGGVEKLGDDFDINQLHVAVKSFDIRAHVV